MAKTSPGGVTAAEPSNPSHVLLLGRLEERVDWHQKIGWIAIGVTATAGIFLFGWIFIHLRGQIKEDNKDQINVAVNDALKPLNEKLAGISEKLAVLIATSAVTSPDPTKKVSAVMQESLRGDLSVGLRTIAALAEKSKEHQIQVDPQELAKIGDFLNRLKQGNPDVASLAQTATVQLVSYRSYLNRFYAPSTVSAKAITPKEFENFEIMAQVSVLPGAVRGGFGIMQMGKQVQIEEAARFQPLGTQPKNKTGPTYFVVDGTGIRLHIDGMLIRNSIIQNTHIVYDGGPVRLENVYFVNCVFELQDRGNTSRLQLAILDSTSVKFSAG